MRSTKCPSSLLLLSQWPGEHVRLFGNVALLQCGERSVSYYPGTPLISCFQPFWSIFCNTVLIYQKTEYASSHKKKKIKNHIYMNKNRNTGPVAYLGPGLMLQPKFGSILNGGSGEVF